MVESTESSSRIEGVVAAPGRVEELVAHGTAPRDRNEQEIAGYRDVLQLIHDAHADMPFSTNVVLQMHAMLTRICRRVAADGSRPTTASSSETRRDAPRGFFSGDVDQPASRLVRRSPATGRRLRLRLGVRFVFSRWRPSRLRVPSVASRRTMATPSSGALLICWCSSPWPSSTFCASIRSAMETDALHGTRRPSSPNARRHGAGALAGRYPAPITWSRRSSSSRGTLRDAEVRLGVQPMPSAFGLRTI